MQRINTVSKATNLFGAGKHGFKDGDKTAGLSATYLEAAWFNAVQEELAFLIESSGISLLDGDFTQLHAAVVQIIESQIESILSSVSVSVAAASDTVAGKVELATNIETIAGTDSARAVTPAGLAAENTAARIVTKLRTVTGMDSALTALMANGVAGGFTRSLSANDYYKTLGPLIIQWGRLTNLGSAVNGILTFPITFPSALLAISFCDLNAGTGGIDLATGYTSATTSGVAYSKAAARTEFFYIAIGS